VAPKPDDQHSTLNNQARRVVAAGEAKFHDAAEYLAKAAKPPQPKAKREKPSANPPRR
jgi:hypothetical protein